MNWHRNEEQGYYYLWCAYHAATMSEEKDSLLYVRILMMMNNENHNLTDYQRFHRLIAPAKAAYESAIVISSDHSASEKELQEINRLYASLQYVLKKTDSSAEQISEAYSCINGLNEVETFSFYDSKPMHFEHQLDRALLKLDYRGICVTLEFTGILDI